MLGIHDACRLFIGIIDDNHLARFDVPNIMGTYQIKGTGFTCHNPAMIEAAQTKGTEAIRITERNQLIVAHDEDGKGALDCVGGFRHALFQSLLRERAIRDRTTSLSTVVWKTCPPWQAPAAGWPHLSGFRYGTGRDCPHHRTLSKAGHCRSYCCPSWNNGHDQCRYTRQDPGVPI